MNVFDQYIYFKNFNYFLERHCDFTFSAFVMAHILGHNYIFLKIGYKSHRQKNSSFQQLKHDDKM